MSKITPFNAKWDAVSALTCPLNIKINYQSLQKKHGLKEKDCYEQRKRSIEDVS